MGMIRRMDVFGYGLRNSESVSILDFAVAYDLMIVNSHFKKKEDHLVTFRSGINRTQLDYLLIRMNSRMLCKDCKVIPSEHLGTQHRLLVIDVSIKTSKSKNKNIREPRVRWWNLTREMLLNYQRGLK